MATSATEAKPVRHFDWQFDCERDTPDIILGEEKLKQLLPCILYFIERPIDAKKLEIRPLSSNHAVLTASPEDQRTDPEMLTRVFRSILSIRQACRNFNCQRRRPMKDNEEQIFVTYQGPVSFEKTVIELPKSDSIGKKVGDKKASLPFRR